VIRSALGELRAMDERRGPSFDALLVRGRRRASFGRPTIARLALAAAVLVAAIALYRGGVSRRDRLIVPSEVVALSAWRPATDVLLESSGRDLLKNAPRLGASLIDVNVN